MAEYETRSAKVWFRVEPSRVARWQEAMDKLGVREKSDFYRDAIDAMADAALEPASLTRDVTPDPKPK